MAVRPSQYWPVLLGISLFAGVAGFRWASSGKGGIVLTVNARDGAPVRGITAFVDGALVACDLSPCTISEQASRIHALKVVVPGFVTPPQLGVEVRPRANVPAHFQLDPSPRVLKVSAAPPGAKLYLDGKEIGELPQEIHDLALGTHIVRVAAGDAYEPVERQIELEPDKTVELELKLRVLKGLLTVLPGKIPATRVTLVSVSGTEQRVLQLPLENLELSRERSWILRATKPGYDDDRQLIWFDDGERRKTYTVDFGLSIREQKERWGRSQMHQPVTSPVYTHQIQETVARYTPSLKRACWAPALATRQADAPTTARLRATLTILPNGSVQGAVISEDPKGYPGLARCISSRVRSWQFPHFSEAMTINVPFVFAAQ